MSSINLKFLESETIDRTATPTGTCTSEGEVLYLREDDLQSNDVTNNRSRREADSEQIKYLTEQNRRQASQILKLKADSKEDQANFNAQLRDNQSKMDSLKTPSEKQALLYILSHPASHFCILTIILGVYLHWTMVSEIYILREQNAALIEQKHRQALRIDKLETDTKEQLREYKIKLDAVNSENLLLRDQIAFGNERNGFLQSQMKQMNDQFKEKAAQAMTVRLQENQFNKEGVNFLVRCLRDTDSASETFTGIILLWGAVQVGYTTKSGLDNCLIMYEAHYHRPIPYQIE